MNKWNRKNKATVRQRGWTSGNWRLKLSQRVWTSETERIKKLRQRGWTSKNWKIKAKTERLNKWNWKNKAKTKGWPSETERIKLRLKVEQVKLKE